MLPHPGSFFDAWVSAASGPDGFWTTQVPSAHFRTASTLGPELAQAVATLLRERPGLHRVLELGAGDGRLLTALRAVRPGLDLVGVDLRGRPPELDPAVGWRTDRWDVRADVWVAGAVPALLADGVPTLVLAVEWLDDLPCRLADRTDGRWYELDADRTPLRPLAAADDAWLRRWWPDGVRVEVGRTRDAAWASVVGGLAAGGGAALLVDYGHTAGGRPRTGTLAAYRDGRAVEPSPGADRNLTAHVAVDAVAAAGVAVGARTALAGRQARVLPGLLPPADPGADPLTGLAGRSRRHALTAPTGWGGHHWLLQEVPPRAVTT
ncbi:SAM-dependent methyltransferase, MidA family [Friedmanniella luteola]|uniref:SAM-dependent methyltransferase, MidA family n=1 Tax=Friedmanniella luteola TaxID=546871 RepID=A0A1H1LSW9_9ACTN|nr:SAM-dependent methyltransferase [Friedmanniella luteola]SDR76869.1 SAM-dependent methyltransferase, MidA family [Friedmanniella luteola]